MYTIQYFEKAKINNYKFHVIYKLLNTVCKFIPFYKNLFLEYNIFPYRFEFIDDLKRLKKLFKQNYLLFHNEKNDLKIIFYLICSNKKKQT